jgi:hypothetical protein
MVRLARHTLPEGVPHLVVYTAFFWFSTAFFIVSTYAPLPWPPGYRHDAHPALW